MAEGTAFLRKAEIRRKIFHVFGILFLLPLCVFGRKYPLSIPVLLLATFLLELLRMKRKLPESVLRVLDTLARPEERHSFSGSFYYVFGVGLSVLFFGEKPSLAGLLVLAIADTASAIFHARGRIHLFGKSLEGFLVFLVVSWGILSAMGYPLRVSGIVATCVAVVENLKMVNDNLAVPLVTAFLCSVAGLFCFS